VRPRLGLQSILSDAKWIANSFTFLFHLVDECFLISDFLMEDAGVVVATELTEPIVYWKECTLHS
jgi:hypothetical protein